MKKVLLLMVALGLMLAAYVAGRSHAAGKTVGASNSHRILYYVDPMHPSYRSDKPGIAPDCGMELEPVYADETNLPGSSSSAADTGAVKISLEQQQLIGIRTVEIIKTAGVDHITAPGRAVADDTRTYHLTSGTDGVVLSTSDGSVGSLVKEGDVLAVFSAPQIFDHLSAFLVNPARAPVSRSNPNTVGSWESQRRSLAVSRLRALGMGDAQLKRVFETGETTDAIEIAAPADGMIISRNIGAGSRADKGVEFYRIADLSHIWVLAGVPEDQGSKLWPGMLATISLPGQQRRWTGRVSSALPQVDPVSRTLQVRLELDNAGLVLRPEMFVNVDFDVRLPEALTIPAEALLDSGITRVVYVERGDGVFEPRPVTTGWRSNGRVEIVSGLSPGERVVVEGTFLLDSESRLRLPPAAPPLAATGDTAALPASAKDPSCGMDIIPQQAVAGGNTEIYEGKTYYFCSRSCRDKFRQNPKGGLARAAGKTAEVGLNAAQGAKHD